MFYIYFFKLGNRVACGVPESEFYSNITLDGVFKIYNKNLCSLLPSTSIQIIEAVNIKQFGKLKSSEISIMKL
jgi:hypothetical protein